MLVCHLSYFHDNFSFISNLTSFYDFFVVYSLLILKRKTLNKDIAYDIFFPFCACVAYTTPSTRWLPCPECSWLWFFSLIPRWSWALPGNFQHHRSWWSVRSKVWRKRWPAAESIYQNTVVLYFFLGGGKEAIFFWREGDFFLGGKEAFFFFFPKGNRRTCCPVTLR